MRIITEEQGTQEWHEARIGRVTASNAHRLTGAGARETYTDELLAELLTGMPTEVPETYAMARGKELEPIAREWYASERPVSELGFCVHDKYEIGCSPDGVSGFDRIIEIKCPLSRTKHAAAIRRAEIDTRYICQMQLSMWVMDLPVCDFISYHPDFPEEAQFKVISVLSDEKKQEQLVEGAQKILKSIDNYYSELVLEKFGE